MISRVRGNMTSISRRTSSLSTVIYSAARCLPVALIIAASTHIAAQTFPPAVGPIGDGGQHPVPGAGHDYIHLLSETVNPANGSLSINIRMPVPAGRGISPPAVFRYNSGELSTIIGTPTILWSTSTQNPFGAANGWGSPDSLPLTGSASAWNFTSPVTPNGYPAVECNEVSGFHFYDLNGSAHNLSMAAQVLPAGAGNLGETTCNGSGVIAPAESGSQAWNNSDGTTASFFPGGTNVLTALANGNSVPIDVIDGEGNTYSFGSPVVPTPGEGAVAGSGTTMEDRNGNYLSNTDTAGRPFTLQIIPSMVTNNSSTFNVYGLNYIVQTESINLDYSVSSARTLIEDTEYCPIATNLPANSSTITVISSITLPNNQIYTFHYNSTYGTVDEIDYPDGGKVTYTWGLPTGYSQFSSFTALTNAKVQVPNACFFTYQTPVVLDRTVYNGGSSAVQSQTFSYSTAWNSNSEPTAWTAKSTTVSTTDDVTGLSANVVYNYVPVGQLTPAFSNGCAGSCNPPTEESIQYFDWGVPTTGTPLETVYKGWFNQFQLACEVDVPNGNANLAYGHFYQYEYGQQSDDKAYDVGQLGSSPENVCTPSSLSAPSTIPLRETETTTFQQFISPQFSIPANDSGLSFYKPTTVESLFNNNVIAKTLYGYDGSGSIAQLNLSGLTNHDEANFPQGITANRGNLTSVTRVCIAGTGCTGNSVTTYVYDETGQLYSITEPCGNGGACPDMDSRDTNFTTTFSHVDHYPGGGPGSGENTNTYLTLTTDTKGFTEKFSYVWTEGQVLTATDENTQTTTYSYNDPLFRLTNIAYPDGGNTSYTYNDGTFTGSPNLPNVATTKLLAGSNTMTNYAYRDGMGHVIETKLSTDPDGPDYVTSVYDGEGRVLKQSLPYRTAPIYYESFSYDAMGKKVGQVHPDGSRLLWCFNDTASTNQPLGASSNCNSELASGATGLWVDATNELGNDWQRTSDSYGDLTYVMEPSGTSQGPSMKTAYTYDGLSHLLSVAQTGDGSGVRNRSFHYNSISELVATNNPENTFNGTANLSGTNCSGASGSWTTCYLYDANGNAYQKEDNRSEIASYEYDSLNRVEQKQYTYQSPTGTPTAPTEGFGYDGNDQNRNPITPAPAYPNTRLTRSINELDTVAADYSYDPMGRVALKSECLPGACPTSYNDFQIAATYTPAGDLATLTNETVYQPAAIGLTYGYDGAERLSSLVSNWTPDSNHPGTLFSAATTSPAAYNAAGQLLYATLGKVSGDSPDLTETRNYDIRDRVIADSFAAAKINTSAATHSIGTIVITPSTTPDSSTAQAGTGSITISGSEQSVVIQVSCGPSGQTCPETIYDSGYVTATINGVQYTSGYSEGSTPDTIASALASTISGGAYVNASSNGTNVISLVAKTKGSATNYTLTVTSATGNPQYFGSPSFSGTPSGSTLTDGSNGDSGTIEASIDGCDGTYNYGPTDTASSVAQQLSNSITQNCSSLVSATPHDNAVSLTSAQPGSTTNWPISVTVTNTNNDYTSPFFSAVAYGMNNGFNSGGGAGTAYSWAMPPTGGGYDAAGNILLVDDSINGAWNYTYDTLNRLVTGSAASGPFGGNYGCWIYDGFGDRTSEAMPTATSCSNSPVATVLSNYNTDNQITTSNNSGRMLTYSYDQAGNVAYDGSNYYIYDGAGRQCAAYNPLLGAITQYIYDAEGNRAAKGTLNWTASQFETAATTPGATCPAPTSPTFTLTTQWVTGFGGEQLSELSGTNVWSHGNFFFGGLHITYLAGDTQFDLTDWIGTKRVVSGASGCLTGWINYPYGNGLAPASTGTTECPDGTEHHFTSKERDSETNFEDGNDYFMARYYGSETGRFLSPDWSDDPNPLPYADLNDPQTLNLYQYVHNNPLSGIDDDGHVNEGCHSSSQQGTDGNITITMSCPALQQSYSPQMSQLDIEILGWTLNKAINAYVWGSHANQQIEVGYMVAKAYLSMMFPPLPPCSCSQNGQQQGQQQQQEQTQGSSDPDRPKGVPNDWTKGPTRSGKGFKYQDPANPNYNYVRVRPDGTIVQVKNGSALDISGNEVRMDSAAAHYPAADFVFRP